VKPDLEVEVLPHEHGLMIKEIIYGRLGLSRGLLRRMKKGGRVCLNGVPAYITQRVQARDRISIYFADTPTTVAAQELDLAILYEDDSIIVINKSPEMAVYPTHAHPEATLANALAHRWMQQGLDRKIRLIHRLDRETSGVIIAAKEPYAYHQLVQQLHDGRFTRTYLALVKGRLPEVTGVIDQPIGRADSNQAPAVKRMVTPNGKSAVTYYRVLQQYRDVSLLALRLVTGRTHQIRVHLSWLGYPILGDQLYGNADSRLIPRQALHSWKVEFEHPRTGLPLILHAPLPPDMLSIIRQQLQ